MKEKFIKSTIILIIGGIITKNSWDVKQSYYGKIFRN